MVRCFRAALSRRLVLVLPWATVVERGAGIRRAGGVRNVIHRRISRPRPCGRCGREGRTRQCLLIQAKNRAARAAGFGVVRAAIRPAAGPVPAIATCALALRLMDADAEPVILALIQAAKGGDVAAIKLVLERVAPLPRNRPVQFDMPAIETAADLGEAMGAILQAAADGELTPDEATSIASLIETRRRTIETMELEQRIARWSKAGRRQGEGNRATADQAGGGQRPDGGNAGGLHHSGAHRARFASVGDRWRPCVAPGAG